MRRCIVGQPRNRLRLLGEKNVFTFDSDEVISADLRNNVAELARSGVAQRIACSMRTYWKSPEYRITPDEELRPTILVDVTQTSHQHIRAYQGGKELILGPEYGVLHHLSYCGPDERIVQKILHWSHRDEVVENWFRRVWQGWKADPTYRHLHPTHPPMYDHVEHIPVSKELKCIPVDAREPLPVFQLLPKISVIIPLYGGEEDIRLCLESLKKLGYLIHEIIVVDDCSPDKAAEVAAKFEGVKVVKNKKNLGFGGSCNRGYAEATGDVILFLNSDTAVPEAGLHRMIESLMSSGNVAAVGPYSNNTGHHQQIAATYSSLETMPLFAEDLARTSFEDRDVDMLVGFALLVRKSVLEEVGLFDSETFGIGMYEDNDLCYRMRRSGYRLLLSRRAFVHHAGSKSLNRRREHPAVLMSQNRAKFLKKWREDLETGFASHLSGMSAEPIRFNPDRRPDLIRKRLQEAGKRLGISASMMVRDEAPRVAESINSIMAIADQVVVVDTGSVDNTVEICRDLGAEVYLSDFPDDFSIPRNISLSKCTGNFVIWPDADDYTPLSTCEEIVEVLSSAPPEIVGWLMWIQFMDQGPHGGTSVTHLKIFRNLPGVQWSLRLHEQVIASLHQYGGRFGVIKSPILHLNYDNSPAGQAKKKLRDDHILGLLLVELPEHPFVQFCAGMTFLHWGETDRAIDHLQKSIEYATEGESHLRKSYALLAQGFKKKDDLELALQTCDEGLVAVPRDPELDYQAGELLIALGRSAEARERLLGMNLNTTDQFSSMDRGLVTHMRDRLLGIACMGMDRYGEACEWWSKAIEAAPDHPGSAIEMFEASFARRDFSTADRALTALLAAQGPGEQWAVGFSRLAQATGRNPEKELLAFLQFNPHATGPLVLLSRLLLDRGDFHNALPMVNELDRLGSAEGAFFMGAIAANSGDLEAAVGHMTRSLERNPGHQPTIDRIESLRQEIERTTPNFEYPDGAACLVGPHVGKLGKAKHPAKGHEKEPRFSIVVVTYNSVLTIGECLTRALGTMKPEDELIVVDNASSDGTQAVVRSLMEGNGKPERRIRFIENSENLFYAKAANIGILTSNANYIVPLNPDAFVYSGWLPALYRRFGDGVAAVGPVADNIGGDQFVGHLLGDRRPPLDDLPALLDKERRNETRDTRLLIGAAIMLKRDLLDKHGLFDENCELGGEDVEISFRYLQLGYQLKIANDVFFRHEQGVSFRSLPSAERQFRQRRSNIAIVQKFEAFFGIGNVPSSMEICGHEILQEALDRHLRVREEHREEL